MMVDMVMNMFYDAVAFFSIYEVMLFSMDS